MLNKVGNNELRMLDQFQMGPNLVRGFAPNGIGPRDLTFYPLPVPAMRWAAPNIGVRRPSCRCRSGSCRRKSA